MVRLDRQNKYTEISKKNSSSLVKRGCYLYYSSCDWMSVKVPEDTEVVYQCKSLVDNSNTYDFDFGPFRLVFFKVLNGGQLRILQLYDSVNNNLGSLTIKMESRLEDGLLKRNANVSTHLELDGHFWNMYSMYFPNFCESFSIDLDDCSSLLRYDYCMDIAGIDYDEIYSRFLVPLDVGDSTPKFIYARGKTIVGQSHTSDRITLGLYNKRLQLLESKKYRHHDFNGVYPWAKYVQEEIPITRFEYRVWPKSLREGKNKSIRYMQKFAHQLLRDYAMKFYKIDLLLFSGVDYENYPLKEDILVNVCTKNKIMHAEAMIKAYGRNYIDFKGEDMLYEFLYETFGDKLVEVVNRCKNTVDSLTPDGYSVINSTYLAKLAERNKKKRQSHIHIAHRDPKDRKEKESIDM